MTRREWLFVGGPPRSGTTLAAWLLNLHPECHLGIESHFPRDVHAALGFSGTLRWDDADGKPCQYPWRMDRLCEQVGRETLTRAICEGIVSRWPARVVGDKSPEYCGCWRLLRDVFPACRMVFTDRGTDATAASLLRQSWGPDTREAAIAHVENYRREAHECPDALWLQLEELEADPEGGVTTLLQYACLPMGMYPMERAVEQIRTGRVN